MTNATIASLLAERGTRLDGPGIGVETIRARAKLTRMIGENYPAFEIARAIVLRRREAEARQGMVSMLLAAIEHGGLAAETDAGWHADAAALRYLRGGWLEEYTALAALHAGADEVRAGQVLRWVSGPYDGVNEVDVIARRQGRLLFVSCKALWSQFDVGDEAQRERLTSALHEADNTLDHFGDDGDGTALVVSTDLFDERAGRPRYRQLHGKAYALDVALITLEDFRFDALVGRIAALLTDAAT